MTDTLPFQDVLKDVVVVERVIQGDLPSISDDARGSLIRELCSLMAKCWNIEPSKRPTAIDCRKSIDWMVSYDSPSAVLTQLTRYETAKDHPTPDVGQT